jgi:hypothetical protein
MYTSTAFRWFGGGGNVLQHRLFDWGGDDCVLQNRLQVGRDCS